MNDGGTDMEAQLSQLRAKREELAAARQVRAEAEELQLKLAAEQLALKDDEAIEAAERDVGPQNKRIRVVRTDLGVIIVKRAHPNVFRKFLDGGKHNTKECEELARGCLVYPTLGQFEGMLAEQPMLAVITANAVAYLAGVRGEEQSAK
jgi:hypothetical protein